MGCVCECVCAWCVCARARKLTCDQVIAQGAHAFGASVPVWPPRQTAQGSRAKVRAACRQRMIHRRNGHQHTTYFPSIGHIIAHMLSAHNTYHINGLRLGAAAIASSKCFKLKTTLHVRNASIPARTNARCLSRATLVGAATAGEVSDSDADADVSSIVEEADAARPPISLL